MRNGDFPPVSIVDRFMQILYGYGGRYVSLSVDNLKARWFERICSFSAVG